MTTAYMEVCRLVEKTRAGLVVVDNASGSFGGDEINRRQVRGLCGHWGRWPLTDFAVCLLAHVGDRGHQPQQEGRRWQGLFRFDRMAQQRTQPSVP